MFYPDSPDEPKDVKIDKFDASSVTLKWKAPTNDGGNPIKGMNKIPIHFCYLGYNIYAIFIICFMLYCI